MAGDAEYPLLANADDIHNKEQNVVVYKAFGTKKSQNFRSMIKFFHTIMDLIQNLP